MLGGLLALLGHTMQCPPRKGEVSRNGHFSLSGSGNFSAVGGGHFCYFAWLSHEGGSGEGVEGIGCRLGIHGFPLPTQEVGRRKRG